MTGALRANVKIAAMLVSAVACGSGLSTEPSIVASVAIVPALTGLKVGEIQQFSVVQTFSGGRNERVAAGQWSSDHEDVATVDQLGNVRANTYGDVTISAAALNQVFRTHLTVVADASGAWSGGFRIGSCSRQSGPGPSPCPSVTGGTFQITAMLSQEHDRLTGTMSVFRGPGQYGSISGRVSDNSQLTMSGRLTDDAGTIVDIADWNTQLVGASMVGTFVLDSRFQNAFGPQVLRYQCEITTMLR